MKIYFAGAIYGGRSDQQYYKKIVDLLSSYGEVLTEHVAWPDPSLKRKGLSDGEVWQRARNWMDEADVVIAEVTQTSLGVGYELGLAESLGKKALCLYRKDAEKPLSLMVAGNEHFEVKEYTDIGDAISLIRNFFESML